MRYLLSVYRRHLPIQTADTAIQNIIQCYLMIAELETELNRTWFYKVFPTLQYPGNGTNLRSIRDILRGKLMHLENCVGYSNINAELVFGNAYFINTEKLTLLDVIYTIPNSIILALSQLRTILPMDVSSYVNQYMNYVMTTQKDITTNPSMRTVCQSSEEFYRLMTDLVRVW